LTQTVAQIRVTNRTVLQVMAAQLTGKTAILMLTVVLIIVLTMSVRMEQGVRLGEQDVLLMQIVVQIHAIVHTANPEMDVRLTEVTVTLTLTVVLIIALEIFAKMADVVPSVQVVMSTMTVAPNIVPEARAKIHAKIPDLVLKIVIAVHKIVTIICANLETDVLSEAEIVIVGINVVHIVVSKARANREKMGVFL